MSYTQEDVDQQKAVIKEVSAARASTDQAIVKLFASDVDTAAIAETAVNLIDIRDRLFTQEKLLWKEVIRIQEYVNHS